jgi:hypothetical protein
LSKDYELLPATSEAMIQVTMIHLMIRRLARIAPYSYRATNRAKMGHFSRAALPDN